MIEVIRPGKIPYAHGLAMQLMLRERLYQRAEEDPLKGYLLALEHPRTVTLGRRGEPVGGLEEVEEDLPELSDDDLAAAESAELGPLRDGLGSRLCW